MNEYFSFFMPIMIGLIVVASLAEMAISGMWIPAYYRYAIPFFRKEYPLTTIPDLEAQIPELEQKLKRSAWRPSIVFRALDGNNIAFRNKFGTRNAMSGLIRLESSQGRMRISGHLYWTFLLMPLLFLVMAVVMTTPPFFLLGFLAVVVMTFGLQRYHYSQIAKVIEETAVSASPKIDNQSETLWQEPELSFDKPSETASFEPEYDPFTTEKPKSGLNNTEMVLIIVLMALVTMGVVSGMLLFG